jgi:hypothetical protein
MTEKVNGFASGNDQFLSGAVKRYTVTVSNFDLTADPANGTSNLDKVIEIISTRAQPVILGAVTATGFAFAVEHADVFGTSVAPNTLADFNAAGQAALRATGASTATFVVAAADF